MDYPHKYIIKMSKKNNILFINCIMKCMICGYYLSIGKMNVYIFAFIGRLLINVFFRGHYDRNSGEKRSRDYGGGDRNYGGGDRYHNNYDNRGGYRNSDRRQHHSGHFNKGGGRGGKGGKGGGKGRGHQHKQGLMDSRFLCFLLIKY